MLIIKVPVPSQSGTIYYNGSAQSPVWNDYDSEQLTIGGVYQNQTFPGTYDATFTPKSGYSWTDGTTDTKTVTWTISKGNINPVILMSGWTYGNTAATPSVSGNTGNGTVTYTYKVSTAADNTYTATKPSDAGTYTVRAVIAETSNYNGSTVTKNFTIAKANINPTVTMSGWTYDNTASTPSVSGNTGNGTVTYTYKVSTAADNTYTATKPSDAGTYTVRAVIAETTNYNGSTVTKNFTIAKAAPTYTAPTAKTLTYNGTTNDNGTAQALINAGTTDDGTIQYSLDNSNWSTNLPQGTNAGNYTVYWRLVGDNNHTGVSSTSMSANISRKNITRVTASATELQYTVSGTPLIPTWNNYNASTSSISGVTSAQWCGGPYSTTFTPKSNFQWSSGNNVTSSITISWEVIDKIAPTFTTDSDTLSAQTPYSKTRTVTVTAEDGEHESGLADNAYSFDNGSTWQSSPTYTYAGDTSTATIKVRDAEGNISSKTLNINVDNTAPSASISGDNETWTNTNRTVTITANDKNGLASAPYSFDGGVTWSSNNSKTFNTEVDTITICIKDVVGNIQTIENVKVRIDKTNPIIDNVSPQSTTYASSRTITVTAHDTLSGIYQYCFDGTNWQAESSYTYDYTVSTQTIKVKDKAGNIALLDNVNIYVDNTLPTVTTEGEKTIWTNEPVIVLVNASDDNAGLHDTPYSFDGGNTWTSQNFYTVSKTTENLRVLVRDKVNNIIEKNIPVYVDRSGPSFTVTGDSNTWALKRTITITNANDAQTQLHELAYSFDGGVNWTTENSRVFVETVDTIVVKVRDILGNETAQTVSVKVDVTSPTFAVSGAGTSWTKEKTFVISNAEDTECGLSPSPYSFDGGISWSASSSYTLNEGTTYYKIFAVRDNLGNISTQTINVYVDAEAPTFSASYLGVDPNSYASVNTEFSATDLVSHSFSYAISYDEEHPENAVWTESASALLPIGVKTIVACRDEAGNVAVRELIPPYSLMPENIDNRLVVFNDSALASAGYTLGPSDVGYLTPDNIHHSYGSYTVDSKQIYGLLIPIPVELNGDYADGYATFLGKKLDVYWNADLTAGKNIGAGSQTCFVLIDAADLTYSITQTELKVFITEYIDSELNMPCNNTTKSTMMKIDIDAPTVTIRYNISTKKCSITSRDLLSRVKSLEYRFVDNSGNKSDWTNYYDKITLPDNTKYVEARSFDIIGNSEVTRSEDLSAYTSPIVITPSKEKENIVLESSYNYRSSLFDFYIVGA